MKLSILLACYILFSITLNSCNESRALFTRNSRATFIEYYQDGDNDGFGDKNKGVKLREAKAGFSLMGNDCDDSDPDINPDSEEKCNDFDDNCNGEIDENLRIKFYLDNDGDSQGDRDSFFLFCPLTVPVNYVLNDTDCDDNDIFTFKDAEEFCDEKDNNCDGTIDEGVELRYYRDFDKDGYGNINDYVDVCSAIENYVNNNGDCDDSESGSNINPATIWWKDMDHDQYSDGTFVTQCEQPEDYKLEEELKSTKGDCNDSDNSLNPETIWYKDFDGDLYSDGNFLIQCEQDTGYYLSDNLIAIFGDCDDDLSKCGVSCNPGISEDLCDSNFYDENCSGDANENCECVDGDSIECPLQSGVCSGAIQECVDGKFLSCDYGSLYEANDEFTCDDKDNDCDGASDENLLLTFYQDFDGDSYSDLSVISLCSKPGGYKSFEELKSGQTDCNDFDSLINPGQSETCDEEFKDSILYSDPIDRNCNGDNTDGFAFKTFYQEEEEIGYYDGVGNCEYNISSCLNEDILQSNGYAPRCGDNCAEISNPTQEDNDILELGIAGYFRFENTWEDSFGISDSIVSDGDVEFDSLNTINGTSLKFHNDGKIQINAMRLQAPSALTIEFLIRGDININKSILTMMDDNNLIYEILTDDTGNLFLRRDDSESEKITGDLVWNNLWHHLAFVVRDLNFDDPNSSKDIVLPYIFIYFDGKEYGEGIEDKSSDNIYSYDNPLLIIGKNEVSQNGFDGNIDEVIILRKVPSATYYTNHTFNTEGAITDEIATEIESNYTNMVVDPFRENKTAFADGISDSCDLCRERPDQNNNDEDNDGIGDTCDPYNGIGECPDGGDTTISTSCHIGLSDKVYDKLTLKSGATIYMYPKDYIDGGRGFSITADEIIVESGANISADGLGFPELTGPGSVGRYGASYGGGAYGTSREGYNFDEYTTYGSFESPNNLGTGGGINYYNNYNSSGGGAFTFVARKLSNSGEISANGGSCSASYLYCDSSGGSIEIILSGGEVAGSGKFSADGVNKGGGGRISIKGYNSWTFTGSFSVRGGGSVNSATYGAGSTEYLGKYYSVSRPGTLYLEGLTTSNKKHDLTLSGGAAFNKGQYFIKNLNIKNNAELLLLSDITSGSGSIINADNINIESGSILSANGTGHIPRNGPGYCDPLKNSGCLSQSGASFGGRGGSSFDEFLYGDPKNPIDLGSGGAGSAGGGVVNLEVFDTLTLNGLISADGLYAQCWAYCGAGSGGSVKITAPKIEGTNVDSVISARGGDRGRAYDHCGGGGRISIEAEMTNFRGNVNAKGGQNCSCTSLINTRDITSINKYGNEEYNYNNYNTYLESYCMANTSLYLFEDGRSGSYYEYGMEYNNGMEDGSGCRYLDNEHKRTCQRVCTKENIADCEPFEFFCETKKSDTSKDECYDKSKNGAYCSDCPVSSNTSCYPCGYSVISDETDDYYIPQDPVNPCDEGEWNLMDENCPKYHNLPLLQFINYENDTIEILNPNNFEFDLNGFSVKSNGMKIYSFISTDYIGPQGVVEIKLTQLNDWDEVKLFDNFDNEI